MPNNKNDMNNFTGGSLLFIKVIKDAVRKDKKFIDTLGAMEKLAEQCGVNPEICEGIRDKVKKYPSLQSQKTK